MTNIDLHKIDRELAEALGLEFIHENGKILIPDDSIGKWFDFHPTTDPVQFIKLQMEYGIEQAVNDEDENGKPIEWKAFGENGEEGYGATPMIAGCLALIEALKEK